MVSFIVSNKFAENTAVPNKALTMNTVTVLCYISTKICEVIKYAVSPKQDHLMCFPVSSFSNLPAGVKIKITFSNGTWIYTKYNIVTI